MIPPLAGGWGSEDEVDSSTAKLSERRTSTSSASFLESTAGTGIPAEGIVDSLRESAVSDLDEVAGAGLTEATAAAVWTVHALTPIIAIV
jgi:hypothetical protein